MLGSWQGVNGRKKVENPCSRLTTPVFFVPSSSQVVRQWNLQRRGTEVSSVQTCQVVVFYALRLECEKLVELTVSSHCSCLLWSSRESRKEAALSKSIPTGPGRKERLKNFALFVPKCRIVLATATWDTLYSRK